MNIPRNTTPTEDAAVDVLRKRHNRNNSGANLTSRQYLDRRIDAAIARIVEEANEFRSSLEVQDAFKAANPATQAAVRAALGL